MKPFSGIQTKDYALQRIQDSVANAVNPIAKNPIVDTVLLSATLAAASDTAVVHGLGRQAQFVFVSAPSANAVVWVIAKSDKTVTMKTTADCTVSLLVG